ncbi:MAG: hypothetical protein KJ970_07485 [Candidatus Eisenbacteria bacterium]|uniref:Uncharacterized protein n=1 Tax=Eiseniibacteriota bacterium TaxID=2212470 RepID=A0A948RUG0_UNCEI|nr:hypothetical protein [Candidatus Eisenbacteria bacterium]MBU1949582.1 hypothetical protein [Candidatus Eisenbacteria bacterium]MBU2690756.1 hypothetical protein [Candidatus Eisenbacteria bacterium]
MNYKHRLLIWLSLALLLCSGHSIYSETDHPDVIIDGIAYNFYPQLYKHIHLESPFTTPEGDVVVLVETIDGEFGLVPVTLGNDDSLDYKERLWFGRGRQLLVDTLDFPTLAKTGLHSEKELGEIKTITGKPVDEINRIAKPNHSSGAGFIADDEDIISVLKGDNKLVHTMGLTHTDIAESLFHVFNVIQEVGKHQGKAKQRGNVCRIYYNNRDININYLGAKGWQESIFNDEILGYWQIEMSCDLKPAELIYLEQKYQTLSEDDFKFLTDKLTFIHTGEMVFFYAMRYGFYEGHTSYRADPLAVAVIFGLKSIQELDEDFNGNLYNALRNHFRSK